MTTERRRQYDLEALMESLRCNGWIVSPRSKLLALLGRERERSDAWDEVREAYAEVGGNPAELRAKRVGGDLIITRFDLATFPYDDEAFSPRARG